MLGLPEGLAPVVGGLRRQSVSAGGAVAFWLGNSVLNPATLVFIGFVLGWRWAALRLGLGALMVIGAGLLADREATPVAAGSDLRKRLAADDARREGPLRLWLRLFLSMTVRLIPESIAIVLALGAARALLFPAAGPHVDNHLGWIRAFAARERSSPFRPPARFRSSRPCSALASGPDLRRRYS